MGGGDDHVTGSRLAQHAHRFGDGAAGVDHVVDQDAGAARDITDRAMRFDLVGHQRVAGLVDERDGGAVHGVGPLLGHLHPAGVGGDDGAVLGAVVGAHVLRELDLRVHVVDRAVEEALDLIGVQIHGDDAVGTRGLEQVGDQAGGDGLASAMLLVLAGIGIKRKHGSDPLRGATLQRVDHDQLFHQPLIQRCREALQDKGVRAAHRLLEADEDLTVGEFASRLRCDRDVEFLRDLLGQLGVSAPREQHQILLVVGGERGHSVLPSFCSVA